MSRPRPICKMCKRNPGEHKGWLANGDHAWRNVCCSCKVRRKKGLPGPCQQRREAVFDYRSVKGPSCELCGFVAVHPAQLDVDHKDGDGCNDELSNLWTLCANCHRLKTMEVGDHLTPRGEAKVDTSQADLFG